MAVGNRYVVITYNFSLQAQKFNLKNNLAALILPKGNREAPIF